MLTFIMLCVYVGCLVSLHFFPYGESRFWGSAQHNITVMNNGWQGEHSEIESNDGRISQEMALKAHSQPTVGSLHHFVQKLFKRKYSCVHFVFTVQLIKTEVKHLFSNLFSLQHMDNEGRV